MSPQAHVEGLVPTALAGGGRAFRRQALWKEDRPSGGAPEGNGGAPAPSFALLSSCQA